MLLASSGCRTAQFFAAACTPIPVGVDGVSMRLLAGLRTPSLPNAMAAFLQLPYMAYTSKQCLPSRYALSFCLPKGMSSSSSYTICSNYIPINLACQVRLQALLGHSGNYTV